MGVSTNAILFYGYCWDDEARAPWELHPDYDPGDEEEPGNGIDKDGEGWHDRYARLVHGLVEPTEPFPERTWKWDVPQEKRVYPPDEAAIVEKYRAFWHKRDELAKATGIDVGSHCASECPMPYVCIASTEITAYRGDREQITCHTLNIDLQWKEKLEEFCRQMRIPIPDEGPKWWLVSYWG